MAEKKNETTLDPNFFLPPNVYDFRYEDKDTSGNDTAQGDSAPQAVGDAIVNVDSDSTTATNPEESSHLPIPETINIVSQTVKAAAGGGYLVDIVIDIPNMNGVETYDVAVTKA